MIPLLKDKVSLFVPELPGYGVSDRPRNSSRVETCNLLMNALGQVFRSTPEAPRKVILGGHDRGARIVHRVAVDQELYPFLSLQGLIMLDIVPTKVWSRHSHLI